MVAARGEAASRNHAVDVGMQQQILSPSVKDGDGSDLSTRPFGVRRHLQQCGGSGGKQQVVKAARVFERQHVQLMRNTEDDMEVCRRQDFLFASSEPTLACLCLTLGAMPVTARVVGNGLMTAARTRVEMTTQSCCAAVLDGAERFQLLKVEARPVSVEKAVALCANEIGHLQGWVGSFLSFAMAETIRRSGNR